MIIISTVTKVMSKSAAYQLKDQLKSAKECKTPPYALFQIKTSDTTITAYESGKVVFQGDGADFYDEIKPVKKVQQVYPQSGSDEVGTGDFFGPVVVCASLVQADDIDFLEELKVNDSKQIDDEQIISVAPILMKKLTYSLLIVDNEKYNEIHKTNNLNAIKAKLHNQALILLDQKSKVDIKETIIDQFTPEKNYYQYLADEKTVKKNISFYTKAESQFLSVACASIIARYTFLMKMDDLSNQYDLVIPKGAGKEVDEFAIRFVKKHSITEIDKICKKHFKNYEKILEQV